jgi:regulatory protein
MPRRDEGEFDAAVSGLGEGLAPVIPLFGPAATRSMRDSPGGGAPRSEPAAPASQPDWPASEPAAPVSMAAAARSEAPRWRSTWHDPADTGADSNDVASTAALPERDDEQLTEIAEMALLKKLRVRSLSVSEARGVLAAGGLEAAAADDVIDRFAARGYLDDTALAEQIVHVGLDRKGQGRRVIAQTLAKRGVSREVADAALLALPDDDRERALDFARSKVRSVSSVQRDAALRRLVGQLARRGYSGSLALDVARQALDEGSLGSGGVRFEED